MEYFRNHRSSYVRKIKDAVYESFNLFPYKLNKFASPEDVRNWKESDRIKQARRNLWIKMDDDDPDQQTPAAAPPSAPAAPGPAPTALDPEEGERD